MEAVVVGIQQRHRSFNLWRPNKSNRSRRPCHLSLVDQLLQRSRHLQNRHAPAGVVVRPRPLMIQMARKRDLLLLQLRIRPRNRRRHYFIIPRMLPRLHQCVQHDSFAPRQPLAKSARRLQRHHERKRLVLRKRLQMPPANQVLIFAPPSRLLVLRVTHNPRRAECSDSQILYRARRSAHEHDIPFHLFPCVVALFRSFAHIHQICCGLATLAVLGQNNRLRLIAAQRSLSRGTFRTNLLRFLIFCSRLVLRGVLFTPFWVEPKLSQISHLRVPPRPRPLRPIKNLSIGRKLQNRHITQSVSPQTLGHQLRRFMKSPRSALPVKPRDPLQISLRRLAAQLIRQRRHVFLRQQRRLLRSRSAHAHSAPNDRHHHQKLLHKALPKRSPSCSQPRRAFYLGRMQFQMPRARRTCDLCGSARQVLLTLTCGQEWATVVHCAYGCQKENQEEATEESRAQESQAGQEGA